MADNDRASWYHGREHPDSCTHGTTPVKSECVPSGLALPLKMISITTVQQKLHMLRKHHAVVMSQVLVPRPSQNETRMTLIPHLSKSCAVSGKCSGCTVIQTTIHAPSLRSLEILVFCSLIPRPLPSLVPRQVVFFPVSGGHY